MSEEIKDKLPKLPKQILRMYARHGKTPGKKCKTCAHLKRYEYGHNYYKCVLYNLSASSATDWRLKWDACGKWEEKHEQIS